MWILPWLWKKQSKNEKVILKQLYLVRWPFWCPIEIQTLSSWFKTPELTVRITTQWLHPGPLRGLLHNWSEASGAWTRLCTEQERRGLRIRTSSGHTNGLDAGKSGFKNDSVFRLDNQAVGPLAEMSEGSGTRGQEFAFVCRVQDAHWTEVETSRRTWYTGVQRARVQTGLRT